MNESTQLVIYTSEDGIIQINAQYYNEDIWITQKQMAELFGVTKQQISLHLKNIFEEEELDEKATVKFFLTVQIEGNREVSREIEHYNLDAITCVGYRISSKKATQFKRWANPIIKDYMIKGFAVNKTLLENSESHASDFELVARGLRTSDQIASKRLANIFRDYSSDYEPNSPHIKEFFATYQNIIHYAVTGKTAAEIVVSRADADKENMGLVTWKNEYINKADVDNAKNYLIEHELYLHQNVTSMFLTFINIIVDSNEKLLMHQWLEKLKGFIDLAGRQVLEGMGTVTAKQAEKHAYKQYDKFRPIYRKAIKNKTNQLRLIG